MKVLYDVCTTKKIWRELPEGNHNETVAQAGYFDYIYIFMEKIKKGTISDLV
jgi:hypothetical protein